MDLSYLIPLSSLPPYPFHDSVVTTTIQPLGALSHIPFLPEATRMS